MEHGVHQTRRPSGTAQSPPQRLGRPHGDRVSSEPPFRAIDSGPLISGRPSGGVHVRRSVGLVRWRALAAQESTEHTCATPLPVASEQLLEEVNRSKIWFFCVYLTAATPA